MINIEKQKNLLLEERIELENHLNKLGRKTNDGDWIVVPDEGDGSSADEIDNADIAEDYEEKVARLNILEQQYMQVNKALIALDNGTYGICEISGKPIPEKRLKAYPSATTLQEYAQ